MGLVHGLSRGTTSNMAILERFCGKVQYMVTVEFLGPIGKAPVEMQAQTLAEVAAVLKQDEAVSGWLSKSAVALNDTMVSDLDTKLQEGDKISILPPVCGG